MLNLYLCIANQHDFSMVVLAAVLCALGSYAASSIGVHAALARDPVQRLRWSVTSLLIIAGAIWTTHFVAMLAFRVPFPSGYQVGKTVLSFVVACLIVAVGGFVALRGRTRRASTMAGAITGAAISAMHFTGMSAFRTTGYITWDATTVVVAILVGIGCCGLAGFSLWGRRGPRIVMPAILFFLGVVGDHFVAMSAATVHYDPLIALPNGLIDAYSLSTVVAAVGGFIACSMLTAQRMHLTTIRRSSAERKRFHDLADFAVEGLLICRDDRIVWANRSIETMTGRDPLRDADRTLEALFPRAAVGQFSSEREVDTTIGRGVAAIPVRVITKSIVIDDHPHVVVAVRDQRERLQAETEMRRLADSDPLTGLANRARFNTTLAEMFASRRSDLRFALLSLDLDRFKQVNDAHGHATGDAVLLRVAGRLNAVVDEGALVARVGGDEFAVLVPEVRGPDAIRALADRIVDVMARPFIIDTVVHEIGVSVGVALAPSDGDTATVLVRQADLALYRAKEDGRGVYRLFETAMDARMQARRSLELSLRRAVARQEFDVWYQVQVDATTGEPVGFEALIRWIHPDRGVIPPSEFIPIAEETNLIAGIGEWVLRAACAEAATWSDPLHVAVNLSPVQFRDPRLYSIVLSALEESGLDPHRLELEVTESVLIADEEAVLAVLQSFRRLGIRISLDDFGTGYSSLSHLRRFPFDKIKIDRSFISRIPDDRDSAAIVRAVVSLGKSLGIIATAEGVENRRQLDFVRVEGCDQIQGYLFGRPVPADQLPISVRSPRSVSCRSSDSCIAATAS